MSPRFLCSQFVLDLHHPSPFFPPCFCLVVPDLFDDLRDFALPSFHLFLDASSFQFPVNAVTIIQTLRNFANRSLHYVHLLVVLLERSNSSMRSKECKHVSTEFRSRSSDQSATNITCIYPRYPPPYFCNAGRLCFRKARDHLVRCPPRQYPDTMGQADPACNSYTVSATSTGAIHSTLSQFCLSARGAGLGVWWWVILCDHAYFARAARRAKRLSQATQSINKD